MEIWDAYNENMEKTGLYLIRGREIPDEFTDFLDSDGYIPTFRERSRKYFADKVLKRGL